MRYYISLIAIAVIGISIFTACQKTAPNTNTAKTNSVATPPPPLPPQIPVDNAPRISLADAKKDFDAGNVVFIDTRGEAAFNQEHIKGAINISSEAFHYRYAEVPKDKKIIAYCSWQAEHTSARAVQILTEQGYSEAFALVGGTQAWANAGYPMEGEQK